ncbi:MAG: hypothetical protein HKM93_10630 [Desulfobacteraceae bacterium]|nr:hypothetical protein [Desulfobacteraceae bacterium]
MYRFVDIIVLFTIAIFGIAPVCADAPATRQPEGSAAADADSVLTMVLIRTSSPGSLNQLRAMLIDIIRVRPDPDQPADEKSLAGGIIVEAVAPRNMLPILRAKGFDVSEIPQKDK